MSRFAPDTPDAVPIRCPTRAGWPALAATLGDGAAFARALGFEGRPGQTALLPRPGGRLGAVLLGVEPAEARGHDPLAPGGLAASLPPGTYRFDDPGPARPDLAALSWLLSGYRYARFRAAPAEAPRLAAPAGADAERLELVARGVMLARDLVNAPANLMGPEALEAAALDLARRHGASARTVRGEALERGFPLIHAVGRAAAEPPRLVDLAWGAPDAPAVTLVGKGITFDTGGLDLKPAAAMLLMKKDMAGAATALALADMVMGAGLPVRLRVLLPVAENSVSASSFRPGDVLASRKGVAVEIGNTDAEGRLVLADALALACEDRPELLVDFATLTGAARTALGPDLPAFYTDDEGVAAAVARHAAAACDPAWRMPLWRPYGAMLDSKVADVANASGSPFAGSVTAALFLDRFVEPGVPHLHFDLYGWNPATKPGRPEGGEAQAARLLFDWLCERCAA